MTETIIGSKWVCRINNATYTVVDQTEHPIGLPGLLQNDIITLLCENPTKPHPVNVPPVNVQQIVTIRVGYLPELFRKYRDPQPLENDTEPIEASGEGWKNGTVKIRHLECAGPVIPDEIKSIPGETLTYEGRPIPYKFNGISGYILVEITGKCLFFYIFDGDVMYDEIGEFSVNQKV